MIRDMLIAGALLLVGAIGGYFYGEWSRPTREDIALAIGNDIASDNEKLTVDFYADAHAGPMVYVADKKGKGIARIEIAHDGNYLVSVWNERRDYFDYHFGKTMNRKQLLEMIEKKTADK